MVRSVVRWSVVVVVLSAAGLSVACRGNRCCPPPCAAPAYGAPAYAGPTYAGPTYAGPTYAGPTYAAPRSGAATPSIPIPPPTPATPASAFQAQAARGQAAFARNCAECHGASGQGTDKAPALVGTGALPLTRPGAKVRTGEFRTAGDVARFAVANMPPGDRPKPTADEYWAIVAFALKANGVSRTDAVSPENADSIVLHK